MPVLSPDQIQALLDLAAQAGRAIMAVRAAPFAVDYKADRSPVTEADLASHRIILDGLARLFPDVPVVSEEAPAAPPEDRLAWERFFLVDPLDGTKEFVENRDEFAVNIALVLGRIPDFGVIHLPALGATYHGGREYGAFKTLAGRAAPIRAAAPAPGQGRVALVSRSHPDPALEAVLARFPVRERRAAGSAYKFCLLAEGAADLYPRLAGGPWEWDAAAGHAIVEGAGGTMTGLDGEPFLYNGPTLRLGSFLATA